MSSALDIEELFHRARAIADPRERALVLAQACGSDTRLRARIERLLAADARAEGFLTNSVASADAEHAGELVGRFKLLERIGEGGFGEVWMAEQLEPVKRKVALKVLKLGMDTKAVVARFEAERQALALMDHAAIAKVFDAGVTSSGRPYFAMELVRGVPITSFCDEARSTLEARLALFVTTCRALQHAHQKGVIHRDVKPSNVLVTLADGTPCPKVIDFGIAKATGVELTDKTLFTGFQQMLGTPEYMAPEQTALGGVDIDTRADVYSLGVLLYELLTGAKPYDLRAAFERGYDEVLRTIREGEPARPSTRAATNTDETRRAATLRALAPRELASKLSGDLDWIVLKALEKDRSRRYDSAGALADDVERFLRDEPVLARPPSAAYQLSKFVRRHRWPVAAGGAVFLALLGGIAASLHFALRAEERRVEAEEARAVAETARTNAEDAARRAEEAERETQRRADELEQLVAFQEAQIALIDPESMGLRLRETLLEERRALVAREGAPPERVESEVSELDAALRDANLTSLAVDALVHSIFEPTRRAIDEQFAEQPLVRASLLTQLGRSLDRLGRSESAAELHARSLELRERELGNAHELTLASRLDVLAGSRRERSSVLAELTTLRSEIRERFGPDHELERLVLNALGALHTYAGDPVEAEACFRAALEGWRRAGLADREAAFDAQSSLGAALIQLQRVEEGVVELRAALDGYRRVAGENNLRSLHAVHSLGTALMMLGRFDDALDELRRGLETARRLCGDDHTATLGLMNNLAGNLLNTGRVEEAEPLFVELVERLRRVRGNGETELHHVLARFGRLRSAQRRYDEAVVLLQEAYAGLDERLEDDRAPFHACAHNLGVALYNARRFEEAEPVLRRGYEARRASLGEGHVDTATTAQALASTLHGLRRLDEASEAYSRAAEALEQALGPDHDRVVRAWRNVSVIATSRRDFEGAAKALRRCVSALRASGGPELAHDLSMLAASALELRQWDEAEASARESLEVRTSNAKESSWRVAHTRVLLGEALLGRGALEEASAELNDAAEQLAAAGDSPAGRAGQLDPQLDACERLARTFETLHASGRFSGNDARAETWRERAQDRRSALGSRD